MAESQFKNLVFEGGGVLGIAYAGALGVVEERDIMPGIERVAGASAGAITASLLALGYNAKGIQDVVAGTSFSSFMDDPGGFFLSVVRSFRSFGWYAGDAFGEWMRDKLVQKGHPPDLTFAQLEDLATRNPGKFRKLYVVASDITRGVVSQFDANETPDVPIWRAVRASMSIPFFFASVRDMLAGKTPSPDADAETGASRPLLVDGGVTWNYPIDIFDDRRFSDSAADDKYFEDPRQLGYKSVYDDTHAYNKQTLGFRVDSQDEIAEYKNRQAAAPLEIHSIVGYAMALIGFMRGIANRSHLKTHDWHRTVFLDDGGIPFADFNLSADSIQQLLANGERGCREYFAWFDKDYAPDDPKKPINKA